jgi:hypothetical protein
LIGLREASISEPTAEPFEQFVRDFVAECKRQNCLPKSHDPQARAFLFGREITPLTLSAVDAPGDFGNAAPTCFNAISTDVFGGVRV